MRLLVTGARGQLGAEAADAARRAGHDVVALDRAGCDVTDAASVSRAFERHRPDAVLNCAAWTRVDDAEAHADSAFAVNAGGAANVAAACAGAGIGITHVSTDYVFDGSATAPIGESAQPNPRSAYGRSKLAGEVQVRAATDAHQIVRTAWLYGRDGPNFVLSILRAAHAGRELRVVADQRGTPTWTGHLAPALVDLAVSGARGTFHVTNSGETTWHGLAEAALAAAGISTHVTPIATADWPTPAARPAYSVLANGEWRRLGRPPLPDWRAGVAAYVASRPEAGQ